jgi:flagellar protein FlbT
LPLTIDFRSGDKLIINGSVIENGGAATKLLVHNKSAVLRQSEVMSVEEATTPAKRIYFALQCAYIFPDEANKHVNDYQMLARDFLAASPSSAPLIGEITTLVVDGEVYKALRKVQKLLEHESQLLASVTSEDSPEREGAESEEGDAGSQEAQTGGAAP